MKEIARFGLVLVVFFLWSCQKEEVGDEQKYQNKHLISATLVNSFTQNQVQTFLALINLQYPGAIDFSSANISGVKVYYVEYSSTYVNDEPVVLSGLVSVPDDATRESLVLSFQNGTFVEHSDAPSESRGDEKILMLQAFAGLGFTIVIPDYIGFGSSEQLDHPYYHKSLFQSTIIDMIVAVQDMDLSGDYPFQLNDEVFLLGYSLGGWATLVTHNAIENNPIEGIELIGSACGAGAYNLNQVKEYLVQQIDYPQPFYVPYLVKAYQSTGDIQDDINVFFNEPYASRLPSLLDGEHSTAEINVQLSSNMQELLTSGFINSVNTPDNSLWIPINKALTANSQEAWFNSKPIKLYHGDQDMHVPYYISEDIYADFVALGASDEQVELITISDADHSDGALPMFIDVINQLINSDD
ncbi:alpha/beta hydrolase [bacterium]|nr:alpha/beta hydrolase [bacterium]